MAERMMRLDALLSRFGYCSRREAAAWLKAGRVAGKSGEIYTSGAQKVCVSEVSVDGEGVEFPDGVFVALNKPVGFTCSYDEKEGDLVYDILPPGWSERNPVVSTIGRLDKDTSGLILLTDDGALQHKLSSPRYHLDKIYEFTTSADIPPGTVDVFASGELRLAGERTPLKPAVLEILSSRKGRLTLTEGRYHQVRRMMESQGAPVLELERIAIGKVTLASLNLAPGEWKEVSPSLFL